MGGGGYSDCRARQEVGSFGCAILIEASGLPGLISEVLLSKNDDPKIRHNFRQFKR